MKSNISIFSANSSPSVRTCFIAMLLCYSPSSYAYLDPGSGSLLLSAILGVTYTIFYLIKGGYYKIISGFSSILNIKIKDREKLGIVFFSEGGQYWNTFKPVVDALIESKVTVNYWTQDNNDIGLKVDSEYFHGKNIGKGNRAFAKLNALEANICVMTTPGLDVFQIRRSKGVKHYCHIIHAPTTGTYKLYSFDYFDSVLCSGQHQIDSIRELEAKRSTKQKVLLETGCAYMDVLKDKLENYDKVENSNVNNAEPTILLAPSWGDNGLFKLFGGNIIRILLNAGFKVIVRPHPQSFIVESDMLSSIEKQFAGTSSDLVWDKSPDNFESLRKSDLMISDLSGVVFDYAFIFQKPVVTIKFQLDLRGLDANHLDSEIWELGVLKDIGHQLDENDLENLPEIIRQILLNQGLKKQLSTLRERSLFNYGNTGQVAAKQIIELVS